tara:strand:- start:9 stop:143 length:135 start_codon:yes stop_codon:yes gene_type:complete
MDHADEGEDYDSQEINPIAIRVMGGIRHILYGTFGMWSRQGKSN